VPAQAWDEVDAVIHLAAIAHIPDEGSPKDIERLFETNVMATARLARQAADRGVRRFVFVSSAAVHGSVSGDGRFTEEDEPAPDTTYARSKVRAEAHLSAIAAKRGLELTIVRPPLVYGPAAKGNFPRLLHWSFAGRPLPSAALLNSRSFIGLRNLCHFLEVVVRHPAAVGQTFLVSDREDISTGELFRRASQAFGLEARFINVPRMLVETGLRATGRGTVLDRILNNFLIDSSKTEDLLDWRATVPMDEELQRTAAWFKAQHHA
jgi:nucleoside-diphosphate-sugar epimerase